MDNFTTKAPRSQRWVAVDSCGSSGDSPPLTCGSEIGAVVSALRAEIRSQSERYRTVGGCAEVTCSCNGNVIESALLIFVILWFAVVIWKSEARAE
jgi:hypothetical protein